MVDGEDVAGEDHARLERAAGGAADVVDGHADVVAAAVAHVPGLEERAVDVEAAGLDGRQGLGGDLGVSHAGPVARDTLLFHGQGRLVDLALAGVNRPLAG